MSLSVELYYISNRVANAINEAIYFDTAIDNVEEWKNAILNSSIPDEAAKYAENTFRETIEKYQHTLSMLVTTYKAFKDGLYQADCERINYKNQPKPSPKIEPLTHTNSIAASLEAIDKYPFMQSIKWAYELRNSDDPDELGQANAILTNYRKSIIDIASERDKALVEHLINKDTLEDWKFAVLVATTGFLK